MYVFSFRHSFNLTIMCCLHVPKKQEVCFKVFITAQKKTWEPLSLLIPHPKALALPDIVERATLIAHADML